MSSGKLAEEIGNCVRQNIDWLNLPTHIIQWLHNNQRDYEKYVFNYSLKNQLRFRGNLASKVFRNEQRYYELLMQKSINSLSLFPYHLADIVSKGLRFTPFNYYQDVLSQLLRNDKSYDTLPNFTAADCLRVLGIGRNEYLSLISDLKTHTSRSLLFSAKVNPLKILPRFPIRIKIEPWWRVELGYVLESDMAFVTTAERSLIDDLIDFGSQSAGKCDYTAIHSLYRKGLIYMDVPISGDDRICIPPLRNFVMNRVSGDPFETLLYKIFVSADEHMTISELAQMLQIELNNVKQAVSLLCRLGFACLKERSTFENAAAPINYHASWEQYKNEQSLIREAPQITPLNYNSLLTNEPVDISLPEVKTELEKDTNSIGYISSDGNNSDFSFANLPNSTLVTQDSNVEENELSSELEDLSENTTKLSLVHHDRPVKNGKRIGFLFDSTLTAFLMMGNLSPGLKNHAVTMFEVGKLCEESMDTFLTELEKVSLLDAEGEGDVSRYFAHAVILRSTICSLRNLLPNGLDLLRLECLECLDSKIRDRILENKYEFIVSATPLTANLSNLFSIPFFGQFFKSSDSSHMWTKLFYNHITGYGPPSLFLTRGTVLRSLPRLFLGYGKLLVNILHSDSYVINSQNFRNLNDQLKNGCVFIQGYGIRTNGELCYEAFPFNKKDKRQLKWFKHKAVQRLVQHLDLKHHCGYITFVNTGVPDIGCESYDMMVQLRQNNKSKAKVIKPVREKSEENLDKQTILSNTNNISAITIPELFSPMDGSEVTSFARQITASPRLKSPDENYFAASPRNHSPSNGFISADCGDLLASELAKCGNTNISTLDETAKPELISQSSVEIPITTNPKLLEELNTDDEEWTLLDVNFGVPLFEVDCNTRICEQIVQRLYKRENLDKLQSNSNDMNEKFLNFIKQCLFFVEEQIEQPTLEVGKRLPHPRINLAFENGRVCSWNGR